MKLKNIIAYIKRKQFYFALFTCCLTLFLIAMLVWVRPKEDDTEIANLNGDVINNEETVDNLTPNLVENDDTDDTVTHDEAKDVEDTDETTTAMNPITISSEEVVGEGDSGEGDAGEEAAQVDETVEEKPKEVIIEIAPVVKPNISFDADEKMIWPVSGEILIPYSMDTPVYFKTLDQYKINPALFIASDVGNEVKVAAEGIVEAVTMEPETGVTVTVYHGNGFKTVYGQLKEKTLVKEGDLVKKGQLLGHVETPTKYHVLLASHLYFKATNNEQPVNPVDLIE